MKRSRAASSLSHLRWEYTSSSRNNSAVPALPKLLCPCAAPDTVVRKRNRSTLLWLPTRGIGCCMQPAGVMPMTYANVDQLRADIDGGRTGDKVEAPDPAAAPLG